MVQQNMKTKSSCVMESINDEFILKVLDVYKEDLILLKRDRKFMLTVFKS